MKRRERAVRAAVESLSMSREAKDAIVDIWREVDASYAEQVRDLKARLRAARLGLLAHYYTGHKSREMAVRATDLRRKNWRKP